MQEPEFRVAVRAPAAQLNCIGVGDVVMLGAAGVTFELWLPDASGRFSCVAFGGTVFVEGALGIRIRELAPAADAPAPSVAL